MQDKLPNSDVAKDALADEDSQMVEENSIHNCLETERERLPATTVLPTLALLPQMADSFNLDAGSFQTSVPITAPPLLDHRITYEAQRELSDSSSVVYATTAQTTGHSTEETEDEGEDDDDNDDDDMPSELSEGEDLQEDLMEALDDHNFSFKGSFYHASILNYVLNPCLCISGLGLVGLPLSERDAKAIISCSTLAPFGHGERTVIDKDVRDTWEIEPSRISFMNAEWENYVNKTLCAELCQSLGISAGNNPPRMQLYKLLLYETGSHFLPHQDTQKADGMFATAIILLPSAYTGGQVVVSHASSTQTIDFAHNSLLSTALLAWYTDVKHEVKPVTSGYRLALSYNLIHTAPTGIPPPCLPDMGDSAVHLRRVLMKWKYDKYAESTEHNLIAYLLKHEYSTANLNDGLKALKGVDLHRVSYIRPIVEEMGFRVGLASLEHNVSGSAEDDGYSYHRRGRYYDDYAERDETPGMAEVSETSTSISGLVDLDGLLLLSIGKLDIDSDCLIPKDPFEDASPDDTEYEGYMGNGAGQLDYWYRRTVLVLMHEDKVDDVCYSAEGAGYAFRKLKESSTIPPTADNRRWANRILLKSTSLNSDQIGTLLDYALKWKDLEMWKSVVKRPFCSLASVDRNLFVNAWHIFAFEGVRSSYEELLARSTSFSERMNFILLLQAEASASEKNAVDTWCKIEFDKILASFTSANVEDVPTILIVIRTVGLTSFETLLMPNFQKQTGNYVFWIALLKALTENRQIIVEQQTKGLAAVPEPGASAVEPASISARLDNIIKECLKAAASQWNAGTTTYAYNYPYRQSTISNTTTVERIVEVVKHALAISDLDICRFLFVEIIKSPATNENASSKFKEVYEPLVPRLRSLLSGKSQDICKSPFVDFMQIVIGLYLRDVLGNKSQMSNAGLRKIGCGCADCGSLDKFILDPTTTSTVFRLVQSRRTHLEYRLGNARDICSYGTIRSGSPHGLQVSKLPAVIAASTWANRQKAAKAFLASIGSETVLSNIMGTRYGDVKNAIDGVQHFGAGSATLSMSSVSAGQNRGPTAAEVTTSTATSAVGAASSYPRPPAGNPSQSALSSTSVAGSLSTSAAPPPRLAGKKRKSIPTKPLIQLGPVIDLTGDNSS